MMIRDTAIAKLQRLPEPLLQEVSDFIDFVLHKHQVKLVDNSSDEALSEAWSQWFEAVDRLEVTPMKPTSDYQKRLLDKYWQQGLQL